jgi:hypothetical protein
MTPNFQEVIDVGRQLSQNGVPINVSVKTKTIVQLGIAIGLAIFGALILSTFVNRFIAK